MVESGHEMARGETKYYIDKWGWLMDENQFYLLDSKGLKIMLCEVHLELLKREGLMSRDESNRGSKDLSGSISRLR